MEICVTLFYSEFGRASLSPQFIWEQGGNVPSGEFQYTVDDKGRVIIPPSFREFASDGMMITRGMEGCLYLYQKEEWDRLVEQMKNVPIFDQVAQNVIRFLYSGADEVKLDSASRISIPSTLRTFAGTNGNVVIAGSLNRLEIWDEGSWLRNLSTIQSSIQNSPEIPAALRELA